MKKYKLGKREGNDLCRVIALRDFADVKKGDIGGRIQSKENLSHEGNAWVSGNAQVYGNAQVSGNALVTRGPINVIMKPFSITITDNHVQVGCELLRKDHLAKDGLAAVTKHKVDKKTVAKYRAIIKALVMAN